MTPRFAHPFWRALILLAYFALAAAYNIALPLFEGADEGPHFITVHDLATNRRLPNLDLEMPSYESAQPPLYHIMAAIVISPFDRSDAAQIVRDNPDWYDPALNFTRNRDIVRNLFLPIEDSWRGAALAARMARFFSTALGALTLLCIYGIARSVFAHANEQGWLKLQPASGALFAMSLVAFNPKFVHITSLVSNDNGVMAFSAAACWLIARSWERARPASMLAIGLLIGCAVTSKLGGLALLAPAGWLALRQVHVTHAGFNMREAAHRQAAQLSLLRLIVPLVIGLLLVAGPWLAHNTVLYGNPLGWDQVKRANLRMLRDVPLTVQEIVFSVLPILVTSWDLGNGVQAPLSASIPFMVWMVLAGCGCAAWAITARSKAALRAFAGSPLAALLIWSFGFVVLFIPWLRSYQITENGRLLLPLVASIPLCVVLGWHWLLRALRMRRLQRTGGALIAGAALLSAALFPSRIIEPAFATPEEHDQAVAPATAENKIDVRFAGAVNVRAASALRSADGVELRLVWGAIRPIATSYRVQLDVFDADGGLLASRPALPYAGRFATTRWIPGRYFEDVYRMAVPADAPAEAARVHVRLYAAGSDGPRYLAADNGATSIEVPISPVPERTVILAR